jgi:tagatose-1,6-bisphosphate aldolase non-catalytic subunit AgaZ/GatZ
MEFKRSDVGYVWFSFMNRIRYQSYWNLNKADTGVEYIVKNLYTF